MTFCKDDYTTIHVRNIRLPAIEMFKVQTQLIPMSVVVLLKKIMLGTINGPREFSHPRKDNQYPGERNPPITVSEGVQPEHKFHQSMHS